MGVATMQAPPSHKQDGRGGSAAARHRGALSLVLSPFILALARAHALALGALALPRRVVVSCLYVFSTASSDLLAYLTAQPTSRMQARRAEARARLLGRGRLRGPGSAAVGGRGVCLTPPPPPRAQLERHRAALTASQLRLAASKHQAEVRACAARAA